MSGDDLNEFSRSLGRMEGKFDSLAELLRTSIASQSSLNEKTDKRLTRVESRQHWYSGFSAAIGAVAGVFLGKH